MTATWARLAASATRVKSFRKASVVGGLIAAGAATGIEMEAVGDCCDVVEKLLEELVLALEGAFILRVCGL